MITPEEWNDIEREIVRAWSEGDRGEAFRLIDTVVARGNDELRGRALLYRGSIYEDDSSWATAKDDFVRAVELFAAGSYIRYTAELSAARAYQSLGDLSAAIDWLRAALVTAANASEPYSGASALSSLLSLKPELRASDLQLARIVTTKAWQTLKLDGAPDLDDLPAAARALKEAASNPPN